MSIFIRLEKERVTKVKVPTIPAVIANGLHFPALTEEEMMTGSMGQIQGDKIVMIPDMKDAPYMNIYVSYQKSRYMWDGSDRSRNFL